MTLLKFSKFNNSLKKKGNNQNHIISKNIFIPRHGNYKIYNSMIFFNSVIKRMKTKNKN